MADFLTQRLLLTNEEFAEAIEYWLQALSNPPVLTHLLETRNGHEEGCRGELKFALSPKITEEIKVMTKGSEQAIFVVLLSVISIFLSKHLNNPDIIVGMPPLKRKDNEGAVIDLLPIRLHIEPGRTFRDILLEVRECVINAVKFQLFPHKHIADKNGLPLTHHERLRLKTAILYKEIHQMVDLNNSECETLMSFSKEDNRLFININYKLNRYTEASLLRFCKQLSDFLERIIDYRDVPLEQVEVISQEEKQFLHAFNDKAVDYPREATIHGLFETQVEKTPNAVAVIYEDR
ncbi:MULTISPECIES: condensation domain-containing protein, partial [Paenibacillus]